VAFDPFILQHAIDPEAVEAGFMNDDDRKVAARPRPSFLLKSSEARQQPSDIAPVHHLLGHFLAAARRQRRDQPGSLTEFQRNEKLRKDWYG
jgi:hypothetical protein